MATDFNPEPNKLAMAAGFGIGITWIALALWSFRASVIGFGHSREDYGLVWAIVGVFLFGAGAAAMVGTYWHQIVLKKRYVAHQHHH